MPGRLSIRVGIGWSPFDGDGLADGRFWSTVETLEELGYDSLWLSDSAQIAGASPLPALAAVAARTERLKLGTGVLVMPPRNPVILARELATVDVLSGGRLLPAGGLGIALPRELAAMGVRREERVGRLEESVAIVKGLWSGEPFTFNGKFWTLSEVTLNPRPTRRRIEFWLGGRAPAALRRIGRIADGWLGSFVGPDEFAAMVATIEVAAAEAGRAIDDDHFGTTLFAAPSAAEMPAGAEELLGQREDLARADHIAYGAEELRQLLARFVAAGGSKFVVIPIARDLDAWLRELWEAAVVPTERGQETAAGSGR